MQFKNFLNSGYVFTSSEYALENKFILANALLLAMAINMLVFAYVMYLVDFKMYIMINVLTGTLTFLLIYLLRIIQKENLDIFGYIVFISFLCILFYTYTMDPLHFPATSWFSILIIPALVIHGQRFAFILSFIYFAILLFFYEQNYAGTRIELILIEFPPLFLTIWFVYFYNERYRDSLHVIEEKHAYMLHQSRMASMGEMIENIAHQWRQPLSQINSSVLLLDGLLKQKGVEDPRIEEKLLEIESLAQYMSHTINDFKDFFEKKKEHLSFTLNEVFESVETITKTTLEAQHIKLQYIGDATVVLYGYPNELQQVLLVIINNAIDSLVDKNIEKPHIVIKVKSISKSISISITDNAGGIDSALLDKVFDPYFTTKKKSEGRGLGLYMSKMIIENSMQGKLSVSNSQNGASFIIEIEKRLISYA